MKRRYIPIGDSIQRKVLDFFLANPDEELSSTDIHHKFARDALSPAADKMIKLVQLGLLSTRRENRVMHYSAGPELQSWATAPVEPKPAPPLKLRVTILVHNAGTPEQRVEVMQ